MKVAMLILAAVVFGLAFAVIGHSQDHEGIPPPPMAPHRQPIKLDKESAESEAHGEGVTFHDDALESCKPGWRLEMEDWWLGGNSKRNLCYKETPDGKWWHLVPNAEK